MPDASEGEIESHFYQYANNSMIVKEWVKTHTMDTHTVNTPCFCFLKTIL